LKVHQFRSELALINLVLSKRAKSGEAWAHRKWLISTFRSSFSTDELDRLFQDEIKSCERILSLYPRNYYAWSHRLWISHQMNVEQLWTEFHTVELWIRCRVSDHSAHHYLTTLVCRLLHMQSTAPPPPPPPPSVSLLDTSRDLQNILQIALKENAADLLIFTGHETLWLHRRSLWRSFLSLHNDKQDNSAHLRSEFDLLHTCMLELPKADRADDQRLYLDRYRDWLPSCFPKEVR